MCLTETYGRAQVGKNLSDMQLTRKTTITKQDIEVAGKSYEAVKQFIYLGSQTNGKNSIKKKLD